MTPLDCYQQQIEKGLIKSDPAQLYALQYLQRAYDELLLENKKRKGFAAYFRKPHLVKGVYLWGGVGIGKTLMMDCFYHALPFANKLRLHFHQFMQRVHKALTKHQGETDPLQAIASELANEAAVLCFDELFVSDITDAMLLGRLFKALFTRGVTLIATSNTPPDDLYKNGLQRSQFLPAIQLLKEETEVIHMAASVDYRLRHLQTAGIFYSPLDETARQNMEKSFEALTAGKEVDSLPLVINGRIIPVKKKADKVVWFEFADICKVPRSQNDYLVVAEQFTTVFISDIPVIEANEKDTICLFISLVDVLYDARVKLVISAALPVEHLYNRGYMIMEYERTHSRLLEMQSLDYFRTELD